MQEVKTIVLEDNIEYIVIGEIENYVYLVNSTDEEDMCIRKEIDDELVGLDNEEEFMRAINLFKDINPK